MLWVEIGGGVEAGFGLVREAFGEALGGHGGAGSAVAAWHDGRWIADLWGGSAGPGKKWCGDSIVQPYSVSKPFAALCALRLVDQGKLDLDAPVERYWPRFRAKATVRQVLSHQAGVVAIDEPVSVDAFYDWDRLCGLLERQEPQWEPGTAHGESALFYGHLVGELVRRIDGRTLGRFLREEVCGPVGLDFQVGLRDADLARAVDLTGLDDDFRLNNAVGKPDLYRRATSNPPGAQDSSVVNGVAWRSAEIPAVNGHGSARAVAGLYAALLEGRLLSPGLLAEATSVQCSGPDLVFGRDNAWGLGFAVEGDGYGMGGLGGSLGWTITDARYAFAFVTGHVRTYDQATLIDNAVRDCLGLPQL
jgi:CubicO group peptidase (beta-lactamase class C family)